VIPPEYGSRHHPAPETEQPLKGSGSANAHGQVFSTGGWTMTTPPT
jgi:hypothetical protein